MNNCRNDAPASVGFAAAAAMPKVAHGRQMLEAAPYRCYVSTWDSDEGKQMRDRTVLNWRSANIAALIGAAAFIGIVVARPSQAAPLEPKVSFANQVMPIFEAHCLSCHSPGGVGYIATNMDLSTYKQLRMGSIGGVTVIPFHADRSPLMRYLKDNWHSTDKNALKMPPLGPQLSPHDLQVISDWIDQGAKNN